ncbi:hypothetical protein ACQEV2_25685 [Streptomyces sp. CA-251387]|uniref:hypothetical protein n=1 Tax=Streptomyces sp. CA-251387 TaxID=3240064 RepID=UPI003D8FF676
MSRSELHPPEGVRIVPLFVTARPGAQNDVVAHARPALDAAHGRPLVVRALRHMSPQRSLPALIRVEPRTVPLIVDVLCRRSPADSPTAARTSAPSWN